MLPGTENVIGNVGAVTAAVGAIVFLPEAFVDVSGFAIVEMFCAEK